MRRSGTWRGRIARATRACLVAGLALGCGGDPTPVIPPRATEVRMVPDTIAFDAIGDTVRVRATLVDARGGVVPGRVTWRSQTGAVSVDSTGLVTALADGLVVVVADASTVVGTVDGVVAQAPTTVTISGATDSLFAFNEMRQLTAVVRDRRGTPVKNARVRWSASDALATEVDSFGVVRANASGVSVITAEDRGARASVTMAVSLPPSYTWFVRPVTGSVVEGDSVDGITAQVQDLRGRPVLRSVPVVLRATAINGDTLSVTAMTRGAVARFDRVPMPVAGQTQLVVQAGRYTDTVTYPVQLRFMQLSSGYRHTCALTAAGRAYCWGVNSSGQLGDGTTVERHAPTPVATTTRFRSLVSNSWGTCGLAMDRRAHCWGAMRDADSVVIQTVPVLRGGTRAYDDLGRGDDGACGVAGGAAWCWDAAYLWIDAPPDPSAPWYVAWPTPALTSATGPWRHVVAVFGFVCGIDTGGRVWCAGSNEVGQLGTGHVSGALEDAQPIMSSARFTTLGQGLKSMCGLTTTHEVMCWGLNGDGQVGVGAQGDIVPIPQVVPLGRPAVQLATNIVESCALDDRGDAHCWGLRTLGTVQRVDWGMSFRAIGITEPDFCGIATDGTTWCAHPKAPPVRVPPPAIP